MVLQLEDITLLKVLGGGAFGNVYLSTKKGISKYFAIKKINSNLIKQQKIYRYIMNEIKIMEKLNHPNIVKFEEMRKINGDYYIIMEYINGGDLSNCLKNYMKIYSKAFPEETVQYLMKQIISAIKYLHNNNIIHRDLKLENIMVNFDNQYDQNNLNMMKSTIKIIDFGLSQYLPENKLAYSAAGTLLNADPLILKKFARISDMDKKGYGKEIDIWSLGTICYEMLTGKKLFKADNMNELVDKLENGTYKVPSNLSKETILFLESMLQYEGINRSNINELENHPFLHKKFHCFSSLNSNIDISNKVNQLRSKNKSQDLDYYNSNGNSFKQKAISNENHFISNEQNFFSQKSSNIFTNNNNNNGRQIIEVNNRINNNNIDYQTFDVPNTNKNSYYYNNNNFVKNYNRDFCDDDEQKEDKACCNIQ